MSPQISPQLSPDIYEPEGGSSRRGSPRQPSPGVRPRKASNLSVLDSRGNMNRRNSENNVNATMDEATEGLKGLRVG